MSIVGLWGEKCTNKNFDFKEKKEKSKIQKKLKILRRFTRMMITITAIMATTTIGTTIAAIIPPDRPPSSSSTIK